MNEENEFSYTVIHFLQLASLAAKGTNVKSD